MGQAELNIVTGKPLYPKTLQQGSTVYDNFERKKSVTTSFIRHHYGIVEHIITLSA